MLFVCKENKKATLFNNSSPASPSAASTTTWCHMDYFKEVLTTFLGQWKFQLYCCLCRVRKLLDFIKKNFNLSLCHEGEWLMMDLSFFWGGGVNCPFKAKFTLQDFTCRQIAVLFRLHDLIVCRCGDHTTWLCKWSTTLSPNDSLRSLNHILSWKHTRELEL